MPDAEVALELALEARLLASEEADEAADAAELEMPASSEDRELAADPVAVDSSDWMDEARLLPALVMEDRREETSLEAEDRAEEMAPPMEEVTLAAELMAELISEGLAMLMLDMDDVVSWAY